MTTNPTVDGNIIATLNDYCEIVFLRMLLPRTPGFQISMLVVFRMASCANGSTLRFRGKRPALCVGKCSNNIAAYRRI